MYEQAVQKIRYQLESQGFTNIADFSKDGDQSYFMEDTIHMGWNGWLAFDKAVNPFVTKAEKAPTYHLMIASSVKTGPNIKGHQTNLNNA